MAHPRHVILYRAPAGRNVRAHRTGIILFIEPEQQADLTPVRAFQKRQFRGIAECGLWTDARAREKYHHTHRAPPTG